MSKDIKKLVYCALCIALATVMSQIRLFSMPMGGSITPASMLFAALPGFFFGPFYGISSAVAYGLLHFILKPEIYSPAQVAVDYLFAFGALGFSGFFSKKKHALLLGYSAAALGRFVFAFLSGYLFFGSYAPEGVAPILYSAEYNISYIGTEFILTLLLLAVPAVQKAIYQVKESAR